MPFEDTKTSEFNQHQKPDKTIFIIYAYLESLIKKQNDVKVGKHIPSGFSMSTVPSFKDIEYV